MCMSISIQINMKPLQTNLLGLGLAHSVDVSVGLFQVVSQLVVTSSTKALPSI